MVRILSIDVGTTNLAWVIYDPDRHWVRAWGTRAMPLQQSSYADSVRALHEQCCSTWRPSVVVLERQLHHANIQTSKLELFMEGYFTAKGSSVHVMQANSKYSGHGLQLSSQLTASFENRKALAIAKNSKPLTTVQLSRLNKKKAVDLAKCFLEDFLQEAHIQLMFEAASKKDDLADALLQALAYAHCTLHISNTSAGLAASSMANEQEAQSEEAEIIVLE